MSQHPITQGSQGARALGFGAGVLIVLVPLILGTGGVQAQVAQPSPVELGRRIYEREKCVTCHQIARRGNSRFPLDGVATRLTPAEIRRWLTHPAEMEAALPRMPAVRMSTMKYRWNPRDLDALVAYLETLK